MRKLIVTAILLLAAPALGWTQTGQDPHYRGEGYAFAGVGPAFTSEPGLLNGTVVHVGVGGEGFIYKGLGLGGEIGYAHWGAYAGNAGIGSVDPSYHFRVKAAHREVDPFVLGGYTVVFNRSGDNAANFGGGVNLWMAKHAGLRLEARYQHGLGQLSFPNLGQVIEFRVGVTFR